MSLFHSSRSSYARTLCLNYTAKELNIQTCTDLGPDTFEIVVTFGHLNPHTHDVLNLTLAYANPDSSQRAAQRSTTSDRATPLLSAG